MPSSCSHLRALVLYANYTRSLSYYDDWREALCADAELEVESFDLCDGRQKDDIKKSICSAENIILLHSAMGDSLDFIWPFLGSLERRRGRLLSFVANEVNLPGTSMKHKLKVFKRIVPEWVATQLPITAGRYLYGDLPNTHVVAIPHALNPFRFKLEIPLAERKIDIGIRSYRYLSCLGDNERNRIMDYFETHEFDPGLVVDVDTRHSARLSPNQWAAFLNQCKGTASTEASGYYLEKDDRTVRTILADAKKSRGWAQRMYDVLRHPAIRKLTPQFLRTHFKENLAARPAEQKFQALKQMRDEDNFGFETIFRRYFRDYPNPVSGKSLSSRHFDAIGTGTCQIMFPGHFNGILQADVHYLALNRDFSNIHEVMEKFHDEDFRGRMVCSTRDYVMDQHTHAHRVQALKEILR